MSNVLDKELGVLLGVAGPILLERMDQYRRIAQMVGPETPAGIYMGAQAQRAEEAIGALGKCFNMR
jgi:hypothetical protein